MMRRLPDRLLHLIEPTRELIEAVRERIEAHGELIALFLRLAERSDRARHVVITRRELQQVVAAEESEIEDRRDHADQHSQDEPVDESHRTLPHDRLLSATLGRDLR
jgi:hypothetical protein